MLTKEEIELAYDQFTENWDNTNKNEYFLTDLELIDPESFFEFLLKKIEEKSMISQIEAIR